MLLKSAALAVAFTACGMLSLVAPASAAAKKQSFEQAYRACKAQVDKQFGPASDQNTAGRMSAGEACMKGRGHTLFGR